MSNCSTVGDMPRDFWNDSFNPITGLKESPNEYYRAYPAVTADLRRRKRWEKIIKKINDKREVLPVGLKENTLVIESSINN